MTLKLADETEQRLVASIKRFFGEEMDERGTTDVSLRDPRSAPES